MAKPQVKQKPASLKAAPRTAIRPPLWMTIVVTVFPALLYFNTIGHEYTLDDDIVIVQNNFTQSGLAGVSDIFTHDAFDGVPFMNSDVLGAGRYRPLSIATFAMEWEFLGPEVGDKVEVTGNDNRIYDGQITAFDIIEKHTYAIVGYTDATQQPHTSEIRMEDLLVEQTVLPKVSHLLNVVFFALSVLVLFLLLWKLFANLEGSGRILVPFFASLLFTAHPIHVEAVANIKGRDEILALLFGLLSMLCALQFARGTHRKWLLASVVAFLLAVLSKESAYPLVAVVPIAAVVFLKREQRRRLLIATVPLLITAIVAVVVRNNIVGFSRVEASDLLNHPFIDASSDERWATIFFTLGRYLQLLVFPHPLTNDYYPYHIGLQSLGDPLALGSLVLNLGLGVLGLWLAFKKHHPVGFAILFYFITLSIVSNILVPVGTFMSERLAFIPSVGFCLALAWLLTALAKKNIRTSGVLVFLNDGFGKNPLVIIILMAMLLGYSAKTVTRNQDWKDNLTLFTKDIEVSKGSAKANNSAGVYLYDLAKAESDKLKQDELLAQSKSYLEKAVEIHPKYFAAWLSLGNCYLKLNESMDKVVNAYQRAGDSLAYWNLSAIAKEGLERGMYDDAIKTYSALNQAYPTNASYLVGLGRAYGEGKGDIDKAILYLSKAVQLAPGDKEALKYLGTSYAIRASQLTAANRTQEAFADLQFAIDYLLRAEKLEPNNAALLQNIGNALMRAGRTEEAQRYLQRAAELGSQ